MGEAIGFRFGEKRKTKQRREEKTDPGIHTRIRWWVLATAQSDGGPVGPRLTKAKL